MIINFFKKLIYGKRSDSAAYICHLRKIGVAIGDDVTIYAPTKTFIDEQYPWMISIGNHVHITEGVKILTHDYSWSVLKVADNIAENYGGGGIFGASGEVKIGDNVFIGMNAIILRNVRIGDNVIIGVGSVVTKDCERNFVYGGNPARKIMSLEQFYQKRKELQLKEAKELALAYYKRFAKKPDKEVFHEYFMLFADEQDILSCGAFNNKMNLCGNRQQSFVYSQENKPVFCSYEEFLNYCFDE